VKAPGAAVRRLALLGVARGVAAGLGLAGVLIVARLLSPAQLGQWSLALAVQGYALHLGEFGLRGVVTTEAARAGRQLPRLLRRYLALRLAISAMVLTLVTAGCALLRPGEVPLVGLVTLTIVPVALQLDWLALVDDRPRLAAGLLVVRPLAFLALLGLAPASNGLIGIAGCFLVAWILAALLSWTACRRPAPSAAGSVPSPARMLRRGAALAAVAVTNQAQLSADLLVVGWALGASPAGDYYLASQVLVAGLLFANAAGQIALARLPAVAAQPPMLLAALTRELTALVRVAGAGAAAIALSGSTLMPLLFGAEHAAPRCRCCGCCPGSCCSIPPPSSRPRSPPSVARTTWSGPICWPLASCWWGSPLPPTGRRWPPSPSCAASPRRRGWWPWAASCAAKGCFPASAPLLSCALGASPSGKAADFGSAIRRFESSRPSQNQ
jgi:polysaccharide transporter, PST family